MLDAMLPLLPGYIRQRDMPLYVAVRVSGGHLPGRPHDHGCQRVSWTKIKNRPLHVQAVQVRHFHREWSCAVSRVSIMLCCLHIWSYLITPHYQGNWSQRNLAKRFKSPHLQPSKGPLVATRTCGWFEVPTLVCTQSWPRCMRSALQISGSSRSLAGRTTQKYRGQNNLGHKTRVLKCKFRFVFPGQGWHTHSHCRYKPKMLMDFIKMNVQKLNIPKLIHACERPHQVGTQTICFECR